MKPEKWLLLWLYMDNDDAYEAAVLVKMAQNMLIGAVCLFLAVAWADIKDHEIERWNDKQSQKALLQDDDGVHGSLNDDDHHDANQSLSYGYGGTGHNSLSNTGTCKALPQSLEIETQEDHLAVKMNISSSSKGSHIASIEDNVITVK
eukprot:723931_1